MSERLVIKESEWVRGCYDPLLGAKPDYNPSELLCDSGAKCCLGFLALHDGLAPETIHGQGDPETLYSGFAGESKYFERTLDADYRHNTAVTNEAIDINDNHALMDDERKAKLSALFKKAWDIELVFEP